MFRTAYAMPAFQHIIKIRNGINYVGIGFYFLLLKM